MLIKLMMAESIDFQPNSSLTKAALSAAMHLVSSLDMTAWPGIPFSFGTYDLRIISVEALRTSRGGDDNTQPVDVVTVTIHLTCIQYGPNVYVGPLDTSINQPPFSTVVQPRLPLFKCRTTVSKHDGVVISQEHF